MNVRGLGIGAFIFTFLLLLSGCAGASDKTVGEQEVKPSKVHHHFLYYTETNWDEGTGDLFSKALGDTTIDKISTDVRGGDFTFVNNDQTVLFVDSERSLFGYEQGKDKEKFAENVSVYDVSNYDSEIITYQNGNNDLYIIKKDTEVEKIASSVYQYKLIGENLYYLNDDGYLRKYNIEKRTEEEIASNTVSFVVLNEKEDLAYLNDDYFLFYRDGKEGEVKRISSESILLNTVRLVDKSLVYLGSDSEAYTLYKTNLSGEMETKRIASDVMDYRYRSGDYYFLNSDNNLFKKKEDEDSATKLASDVYDFKVNKHGIFMEDQDRNVYTLSSKGEKQKIASDVLKYQLSDDGEIVYQTNNNELYVGEKKITSDLQSYSYVYGSLIYSTKEKKLYMMKNMKDPEVVDEDLSAYHFVYYHGKLVFKNELGFKDIAGVWRSEYDNFIEIKADGTVSYLFDGETVKLEVENAEKDSLYAYNSKEDDYVEFARKDENTLYVDNSAEFSKSSKAEAEQFITEKKEAADQQEVREVVSSYVTNFDRAVNEGDGDYIAEYISPMSEFYKNQTAYVEDLYKRDIREELLDYEITAMDKVNDDTYKVTVQEEFAIYNWNTGDNSEKEFNNIYTVARINGEFLIADMAVSTK